MADTEPVIRPQIDPARNELRSRHFRSGGFFRCTSSTQENIPFLAEARCSPKLAAGLDFRSEASRCAREANPHNTQYCVQLP